MAVTLLATQVPLPIAPTTFYTIQDQIDGGELQPHAEQFHSGQASTVPERINALALRVDLASRYGGGCNSIAWGLSVSAGAGLIAAVSAGHALIDAGIVELSESTEVVVPSSASVVHLYLKNDGTLEARNHATYGLTPPPGQYVYLGSVTTSVSAVLSVDESGRFERVSGIAVRRTADLGRPQDVPPSGVAFIARTEGGEWLWDGYTYRSLVSGLAASDTYIPAGQSAAVGSNQQSLLFDTLTIDGTLTAYGTIRVIE